MAIQNGMRSPHRSWLLILCAVVLLQPLTSAEAQTWPNEPNYADITKQEAHEYAENKYGPLNDREQAAVKWAMEFQPSVLTLKEQIDELMWFAHNAEGLRNQEVESVAETIKTHKWESDVLTEAFSEITGIDISHDIIGEGELVKKLQTQLAKGRNTYDIYVSDADLIGLHLRLNSLVNLTEYMDGRGRGVTNPTLDLDDWLNLEFGQNYEGEQLQLPDQQFANLYWFRYDWFTDSEIKKEFRNEYGYELGVPRNWAAYEDIAEFFTESVSPSDVGEDAKEIYGHMDYGKKSPSLGWRFTDGWLSTAGVGDTGLPNGSPVAEWGIRVENRIPVGSTVDRGGATNGPAAYYAMQKYIDWLDDYAPPFAKSMRWAEAGPVSSRGNIAQRVFQYTTFLSADPFTDPESAVTDGEGNPKWRMAPTPHGRYWDEGMKVGYQDAGSWSIPKQTPRETRKAAWMWAQFASSKTVSLKKFNIGRTPVRSSTVNSAYWEKHEGQLGGLITFYKSPVEDQWTDTGKNVPHYPLLAEQWWKQVAGAVTGEKSVEQAMNDLAKIQNSLMKRLRLQKYSPDLNEERSREYWLSKSGAPKAERGPEAPKTVPYDDLVRRWKGTKNRPSLATGLNERKQKQSEKERLPSNKKTDSDFSSLIDAQVPETQMHRPSDVAVVIGNRSYQNTDIPNVDYAVRDAKTMKEYLTRTLGFKEENVIYVEDASGAAMRSIFGTSSDPEGQLYDYVKPGESSVFVYYSGHGAPNPESGNAYFIPSNTNPSYISQNGYPVDQLYENLAQLPAESVTVVLEACFSGVSESGAVVSEISPAVLSVENPVIGLENGLAFTAGAADQVSTWYDEKEHGLFTYYFLKALRGEADENGDDAVTAKEIGSYLGEKVPYRAQRMHSRKQTPQVVGQNKDRILVQYDGSTTTQP